MKYLFRENLITEAEHIEKKKNPKRLKTFVISIYFLFKK